MTQATPATALPLQDFVLQLVQSLCDQPEEVAVTENDLEGETALQVGVSSGDFQRLMGAGGRVARSLRTVAGAVASKAGTRCTLNLRSAT